jgi:hypothetical protein
MHLSSQLSILYIPSFSSFLIPWSDSDENGCDDYKASLRTGTPRIFFCVCVCVCVCVCMSECLSVSGWVSECMSVSAWERVRVNACVNACVDVWVKGVGAWVCGCMSMWMYECVSVWIRSWKWVRECVDMWVWIHVWKCQCKSVIRGRPRHSSSG